MQVMAFSAIIACCLPSIAISVGSSCIPSAFQMPAGVSAIGATFASTFSGTAFASEGAAASVASSALGGASAIGSAHPDLSSWATG
jgi:hypothetical protein